MAMEMSLIDNSTVTLFSTFMPRKKEIPNPSDNGIFEVKEYTKDYFSDFDPTAKFTKWAAIEVIDFSVIPNKMRSFVVPSGKYAVFGHKSSNGDDSVFEYLFKDWLPKSGYKLDNRPHFDILEDKSKKEDSTGNEEIWIPIE